MKTEYFRVGDTVYHYAWGKGVVKKISENITNHYPLYVDFTNIGNVSFTLDGKSYSKAKCAELSQTPYDLINGGFTLKPLLPDIAVDTPVFVRDKNSNTWALRYFRKWNEQNEMVTFEFQRNSSDKEVGSEYWKYWSLEIPKSR